MPGIYRGMEYENIIQYLHILYRMAFSGNLPGSKNNPGNPVQPMNGTGNPN